jgi:hypothetical protein
VVRHWSRGRLTNRVGGGRAGGEAEAVVEVAREVSEALGGRQCDPSCDNPSRFPGS